MRISCSESRCWILIRLMSCFWVFISTANLCLQICFHAWTTAIIGLKLLSSTKWQACLCPTRGYGVLAVVGHFYYREAAFWIARRLKLLCFIFSWANRQSCKFLLIVTRKAHLFLFSPQKPWLAHTKTQCRGKCPLSHSNQPAKEHMKAQKIQQRPSWSKQVREVQTSGTNNTFYVPHYMPSYASLLPYEQSLIQQYFVMSTN